MEKVGRRLGILLLLAISLLPSVQAYDGIDADRTNNLRAISYRSPRSPALQVSGLTSRFW